MFIDFFTSWPALILHLAPFIFAMAPLFVTFTILSLAYADAYRNASARGGSKVIDSSVATSSDERAATAP